jgi:hypothetical protein
MDDGELREAVSRLARTWRKCRNGFDPEREQLVRQIGQQWPELFEELDTLHREWD